MPMTSLKEITDQILKKDIENLDQEMQKLKAKYKRVMIFDDMPTSTIEKIYHKSVKDLENFESTIKARRNKRENADHTLRNIIVGATAVSSIVISCFGYDIIINYPQDVTLGNYIMMGAFPLVIAGTVIFSASSALHEKTATKKEEKNLAQLKQNQDDLTEVLKAKKANTNLTAIIEKEYAEKHAQKQIVMSQFKALHAPNILSEQTFEQ